MNTNNKKATYVVAEKKPAFEVPVIDVITFKDCDVLTESILLEGDSWYNT